MGSAKMIDNESVKSDPESEADGAPSTRSCEAIERIEDMVTSLLTQLAFSGRSTSAHSISDDDPEPEVDEFSTKVLRGKSKIELQLADRSKRIVLGATNYKYLKYPRKSSTSSAKPFGQCIEAYMREIPTFSSSTTLPSTGHCSRGYYL